ncbi:Imm6 family immunity protein [Listeria booriae]|uniref:Immunity protein Imm6 n=1 Tax=Listeria booriae TaxID=1552123 RepID=A0A7X0ZW71_9LIST|nr:Imm6 family immunity protein [Listeria booriae]MBC2284095.1 hypothetical protein [Listeria booriae]MBC2292211.1 hypothetical protein [Listeria booriae]MBC2311659.1 hypothetical protein [Listeria booriae]
MNNTWMVLDDVRKRVFYLIVAEKIFSFINMNNSNYDEGRKALDICWESLVDAKITGDDIYLLIDSPVYKDIGEFAQQEENPKKQEIWYIVLDAIAYIAWNLYRKCDVKFLPQALESISEDSAFDFIRNLEESGYVKKEDVNNVLEILGDKNTDISKGNIKYMLL